MKNILLKAWENSGNYTMAVAEAMPEKNFKQKIEGSGWNFTELMQHIAYGIGWWEQNFILNSKSEWNPTPVNGGKSETLKMLQQAYDHVRNSLKKQSVSEELVNGFNATLDHITHHRGQAVIFLRAAGVTPPEYQY